MPLGPAYQPVPPPGTVVVAHRSAPPPSPVRPAARRATPRRPRASRLGRRAVPRCARGPLSLPHSRPPRGDHPQTPSSTSVPPLQIVVRRRRARLSFSLPRSPSYTAKRPTSRPRRRPSHCGPHRRVSDRCRRRFFLPAVRPSQSATIFCFGATLTSLVLPCSS
jgi:hypothetical protein